MYPRLSFDAIFEHYSRPGGYHVGIRVFQVYRTKLGNPYESRVNSIVKFSSISYNNSILKHIFI